MNREISIEYVLQTSINKEFWRTEETLPINTKEEKAYEIYKQFRSNVPSFVSTRLVFRTSVTLIQD